jgi:DNA-binding IclR family transcriptional regulator
MAAACLGVPVAIRATGQLAAALKVVRADGYAAIDSELESGIAGAAHLSVNSRAGSWPR